jgi:glycerol-3-phosphate responsive antiterminator
MLAYWTIAKIQEENKFLASKNIKYNQNKEEEEQIKVLTNINFDLIEKSIKVDEIHQKVSDFDTGFIKGLSNKEEKIGFIKKIVLRLFLVLDRFRFKSVFFYLFFAN